MYVAHSSTFSLSSSFLLRCKDNESKGFKLLINVYSTIVNNCLTMTVGIIFIEPISIVCTAKLRIIVA